MLLAEFKDGIHVGDAPVRDHAFYRAGNLFWVDHAEYSTHI